jgi:uncharacterized protein YndB with AHSA1/START domain
MTDNTLSAKTAMLIRKPVAEVFEAFINPAITSNFWFTKGSGRLESGAQIQWDWEMYGASAQVNVQAVEPNKRILIEWDDPITTVEWLFTAHSADATYVTITNTGFQGDSHEVIQQALNATEAFTIVLCGLKAFLEHNIRLNLIADKFPDAVIKHG